MIETLLGLLAERAEESGVILLLLIGHWYQWKHVQELKKEVSDVRKELAEINANQIEWTREQAALNRRNEDRKGGG